MESGGTSFVSNVLIDLIDFSSALFQIAASAILWGVIFVICVDLAEIDAKNTVTGYILGLSPYKLYLSFPPKKSI